MKKPAISSRVIGVGVCITLIVVLLQALGVLRGWEYRSIDFRYRNVPRHAQPMTDEIVHIDIDDGAIYEIGRWPWPRSRLADAIDELHLAKVKTVALDLLFSEPSVECCGEVDHDGKLGEALRQVNAVLAVTLDQGDALADDMWTSDTGSLELRNLLDELSGDLRSTNAQAMLTGPRVKRFCDRPREFRRAAAALRLQADDSITTFEQFARALIPSLSDPLGSYSEKKTLLAVWDQHQAWESLQESIGGEPARERYRDLPPIKKLAKSARTIGFVNIDQDQHADGAVREVSLQAPTPGGDAVQFGLAAAATHLGLMPADIEFADDEVWLDQVSLPLRDGRLWLDWPTSETEPRWLGLLPQTDPNSETAGHISIRQLVEMADQRRELRDYVKQLTLYFTGQAPDVEDDDILLPETLDAVGDKIESALDDLDEDEAESAREYWRITLAQVDDLNGHNRKLQDLVKGKLAFVGWIATGSIADFVPTAVGSRTPGVVIHAAVANMALDRRSARFMPRWLELVLTALLGVLCTVPAARFSSVVSTIIAAVVIGAYVLVADVWAFRSSTVLAPMVAPLLSGGASWMACTTFVAVVAQRARRRIERQFKRRVSPDLVDYLKEHPDTLELTDEREITVMFTDLAGFTSISESLGGPDTVTTLNRYMEKLAEKVVDKKAYLNKFLGDGFMAFWSAFKPNEDQAPQACQAALNCQNVMARLNDDPKYEDVRRRDLRLRIGIATGMVVVGDCGAREVLSDYTVIGDSVNLAARLESANKQFGTDILIDGATQSDLDPDDPLTRPIGRVVVVGQKKAVDLFAVLPAETDKDEARSLMDLSAELVAAATSGRIEEARRLVKAIEVAHPRDPKDRDPILALYDKWLPDDNWDGVIWLAKK